MFLDMFLEERPVVFLVVRQGLVETVSEKIFAVTVLCVEQETVRDVKKLSGVDLVEQGRQVTILKPVSGSECGRGRL